MFKTSPAQSEYVTRKQLIDKKLRDAGWRIVSSIQPSPSRSWSIALSKNIRLSMGRRIMRCPREAASWAWLKRRSSRWGRRTCSCKRNVTPRRDQIEERARTTAGQFNLNLEILRGLQCPVPPLQEQHEIIHRVEALVRLADAIEERVAAATLRAEKLTLAVLTKAFRGELVPTEAELARPEGREYEPASVLLQRIKLQKTQISTAAGRSRRRAATKLRTAAMN